MFQISDYTFCMSAGFTGQNALEIGKIGRFFMKIRELILSNKIDAGKNNLIQSALHF